MMSYNTMVVLAGAALLGAGAGAIGCFAVLRRRALVGDALSHATLPGLCIAFLLLGHQNIPVMLVGALASGVLGVGVITALRRWTRIKEDAAIGIVLGVFFGTGIALRRIILNVSTEGSKAGLDAFIWGKTSGMLLGDVYLIAAMSLACALLIALLYKEFKVAVFDADFATAQGWPVWRLDMLLMSLIAVAVVIGLPAVGAVLMAAMLILPAAAARFWTNRLGTMLWLSALFGSAMGLLGTAISVRMAGVPTGPVIVTTGSAIFTLSMLLAPKRGAVARLIRQFHFRRQLAAGLIDAPGEIADGTIPVVVGRTETPPPVHRAPPLADSGRPHLRSDTPAPPAATLPDVQQVRPVALAETQRQTRAGWAGIAIAAIAVGAALAGWMSSLSAGDRELAAWTMLIGAAVNVPCAILGCFLVLRRISLLGDAISHAVLPGIVLAVLLTGQVTGLPISLGAMIVGMLTAFFTQSLKDLGRVPEDSSMGIVYTTLFAIGVILLSRYASGVHLDIDCVLFGELDVVAIDLVPLDLTWPTALAGAEIPRVLPTMAAMCALVIALVWLLWKELKISSFDAGLATAMGLSAGVMHYLLMAVVAATTVTAFEAIGSILVIAMLVVPAATGQLLADRLASMMAWAVVVAIVSAVGGQIAAHWLNTNVAAMIAVVAGLQFALAVFFAPRHGLIAKRWRNFSLSLRIAGEDVLARLYRAEEALGRGEPSAEAQVSRAERTPRGLAGRLAIPFLFRQGQLGRDAFGNLQLTEAGRDQARSIVRSHRLWETYLGEQAELPLDHLHAPAERMEHFIGRELQEQIAAHLHDQQRDPHGREIPE